MSLKVEILKNNIPFDSLEDDSLVQLFREMHSGNGREKLILRTILKILLERKKLYLLTSK